MNRGRQIIAGVVLLMFFLPALVNADADPKLNPLCYPLFQLTSDSISPGETATVCVELVQPIPISGFELLIEFDPTCLTFIDADQVGGLSGWEYFEFRYGELARGETVCPTGRLRIVAMADTANHLPEGCIVELTFGAAQGFSAECGCVELRWAWHDCGDNTMLSLNQDTMYFAYNIADLLPDQECLNAPGDRVAKAVSGFVPGEVCIIQSSCWRGAGDCDDDGEIDVADVVYLIEYAFAAGPEPVGNQECDSFCRANVYCDGLINLQDVAQLVRFVFQQPQPLPCCRE